MQTGLMRANFKMQRLFVDSAITAGQTIALDRDQSNYLRNVLRMSEGAEVLVFNGRDGEWRSRLETPGKKDAALVPLEQTRPQPLPSDLHYLFAPLKQARLDYMVQKAVEMGAGHIVPVLTHHTQVTRVKSERLAANAREAAEQCGILSIPETPEPVKLDQLLSDWDSSRRIIFCDEGAEGDNPVEALREIRGEKLAVLIGPEGGFSPEERATLIALPFVTAIPLGPRILRADTAAVAALALVQATIGDWVERD